MLKGKISAWQKAGFAVVILIAAIALFGCVKQVQASGASRLEVEFEYILSTDGTSVIPQAKVIEFDFETGMVTSKVLKFPKASQKIPKKAQYKSKEDSSKTEAFSADFDSSRVFSFENQMKVYVVAHLNSYTKQKPATKVLQHDFIYEFDPKTEKLIVLNSSKMIDPSAYPAITLFLDIPGYMIRRVPHGEAKYEARTTEVFSLPTKKLITRISEKGWVQEGVYRKIPYLDVHDYILTTSKNPEYSYYQVSGKTYQSPPRYYTFDGKAIANEDLFPSTEASRIKSGSYEYVAYKNEATNLWRVGYKVGKSEKIIPLTSSQTHSRIELSNHDQYLVIREFPKLKSNGKTDYSTSNLIIIDLRTAKILHTIKNVLPGAPSWLLDRVDGDIVSISSMAYLHLPTGLISKVLPNSNNRYENKSALSGSTQGLLSLQPPPTTYVDGRAITFAGQGPFMTHDNRWYIEAGDFAKAVDAKLTRSKTNITLTKGSKTLTVPASDKDAIFYAGKAYIPLERLNESMGVVAAFMDYASTSDRYSYDVLRLFTQDLTESQVAADPAKYEFIEEFEVFYNSYYEVEKGKVVAKPTVGMQGYYSGNTTLIFKDGRLKNAYAAIGSSTLRNINLHLQRATDLDAIYGKPKVNKIGEYTLRWYEMDNHFLVFECLGNTIWRIAYITKS
ncbi:hypothetical protein [Saccharibacillus endophyticus]|uniref:Copper amine oxidase-like N-terminal domain-containing protein n=1 Tax=Saccharibacillus endophyticus TaxID=2060666 RepID=A0ABQ1ZIG3_9BACL|nr:hypothetical protein [Saccharibacillus endophyticus]GGH68024.1 hypothetical protein GCM10007362_01610 [Saccharibacillus endophyticus]